MCLMNNAWSSTINTTKLNDCYVASSCGLIMAGIKAYFLGKIWRLEIPGKPEEHQAHQMSVQTLWVLPSYTLIMVSKMWQSLLNSRNWRNMTISPEETSGY